MANFPSFLNPGDKIGIIATARKVNTEEINNAANIVQSWGFEVVIPGNLFEEENQYAGSDAHRASVFQEMLDRKDIKAIIFARGGYGTVRIIDSIDWTQFLEYPKWLCGFSDITVIHNHLHTNYNFPTLHSVMMTGLLEDNSEHARQTLEKSLKGQLSNYTLSNKDGIVSYRNGQAKGTLIGGNLSLIHALSESNSDIDTDGKVLFIEDLDEYLYHIDRMMWQLKRAGKLKNLAGLIVGGMTSMRDNQVPFGKDAETIIWEAVKEYDYPVVMGFPAGHIPNQHALFLGTLVELNVKSEGVQLNFLFNENSIR